MGFLEVVGVASILPFMQMMAEPNAIEENRWLRLIYQTFAFESPKQMLIYCGIGLIGLIAVTNIFSVFAIWLQYKFSWGIAHNLGIRLLRTYLNKPYNFFLNTNTSDLQAYIIAEVGSLTGGVIISVIEVFSRAFISIVIFSLLVLVDPKIALIMFGGLGSAYILIYLSQKNYIKKIGHHRLEMNLLRYRSLKELLDGIKTIKVFNKQDFFYDRYEHASNEFCNIQPKYNLLLAAPKSALEFLAFGTILGITMHLFISSGSIQSALPRLSLYAVAGYRLLPAMQKIFTAIAKFKHNFPIVDKLYQDLHSYKHIEEVKPKIDTLPFESTIELDGLKFYYENTTTPIINDLKVSIKKGQTVAFIGSTGSGKTTLVDLIVGLLNPTNGAIKVDGKRINSKNIYAWQQHLAYVPQEVFLFDDSITNNILLGKGDMEVDLQKLKTATQLADIYDFINTELPEKFETEIGERGVRISGGQRQRLGLARAIYKSPSVLILDEATSALDSITEKSIIESLKTLPNDITTIIIAHRLSTVKHADCIYILKEGQISAKGTYESLVHSNESFKTMVNLS